MLADELKISRRNLTKEEKKNVFMAVACGCMTVIDEETPGPDHSVKKRKCRQFRQMLLDKIAPLLPRVSDNNMELFMDTIKASDKIIRDILKDTSETHHVMLNLASFCLEELPLNEYQWDRFKALFDLWEEAYEYKDVRSGDRIFQRIETEVVILVAQRGGVIL